MVTARLTPIWPGALILASGAPPRLAPATSWASAPALSLCLRTQQYRPLLEMCACACFKAFAWMFPGLSHLLSITQTQHRGPSPVKTASLPRPPQSVHCLLSWPGPYSYAHSHIRATGGHSQSNPTWSSRHVQDAVSGISGGSRGHTDLVSSVP